MRKHPLYLILILTLFAYPCASKENHAGNASPELKERKTDPQKVYDWLTSLQMENGLLPSSRGGDVVSLYDNSLAAIVFSCRGDFERAKAILDFFDNRRAVEMLDPPQGFGQFRNCQGDPGTPHRWLGDNAWLLIAIRNYRKLSDNPDAYQSLAKDLEQWIRALQRDADGAIMGGIDSNGNEIGVNVEGNIDSFCAVSGYDDFHRNLLRYLGAHHWDGNKDMLCLGGNYRYILDFVSWGYSTFEDMPKKQLKQAEKLFLTTQTATANGVTLKGFCFDKDLNTIWLEGTGQMVVAFKSAGLEDKANEYLVEMEKLILEDPAVQGTGGLPYVSNPGDHATTSLLWSGAELNPCVSSSTWYLLGKWGHDPMRLDRGARIPKKDKFWK